MKKNKLIFGIISLALLILAIFCPPILGMSAEGARCLIVFIVFLILSLTNILPSGMASILCTCFMGVIGALPVWVPHLRASAFPSWHSAWVHSPSR